MSRLVIWIVPETGKPPITTGKSTGITGIAYKGIGFVFNHQVPSNLMVWISNCVSNPNFLSWFLRLFNTNRHQKVLKNEKFRNYDVFGHLGSGFQAMIWIPDQKCLKSGLFDWILEIGQKVCWLSGPFQFGLDFGYRISLILDESVLGGRFLDD